MTYPQSNTFKHNVFEDLTFTFYSYYSLIRCSMVL